MTDSDPGGSGIDAIERGFFKADRQGSRVEGGRVIVVGGQDLMSFGREALAGMVRVDAGVGAVKLVVVVTGLFDGVAR
jgi:hypothetical protein